jgi:hypothetical protein
MGEFSPGFKWFFGLIASIAVISAIAFIIRNLIQ